MNTPLIQKALQMMLLAHKDQRDKQNQPYIFHPINVAFRVAHLGEDAICAALLHDTVEDSKGKVTFLTLVDKGFPERVVEAVELLTHNFEEMTYEAYVKRIVNSNNFVALAVKQADLMENTREDRRLQFTDEEWAKRKAKYEPALKWVNAIMNYLAIPQA